MYILPIFIGNMFLYSKSRYFPENFTKSYHISKKYNTPINILSVISFYISYDLLRREFDVLSALMIFIFSSLCTYALLVTLLKVDRKFIYLFLAIFLGIISFNIF